MDRGAGDQESRQHQVDDSMRETSVNPDAENVPTDAIEFEGETPSDHRQPPLHNQSMSTSELESSATLTSSPEEAPVKSEPDQQQDVNKQERAGCTGDPGPEPALFVPFWLAKSVLGAFIFSYTGMIIVLVVLFTISQQSNGLGFAPVGNHLLWTYGPTAVLVLMGALWGQVEYRTKQLMPWLTMKNSPSPARNSVLLDYLSPFSFFALLSSIKARHWPVALAIFGSFMLQLAIVASSGLLSLQAIALTVPTEDLSSTFTFNTSDFLPLYERMDIYNPVEDPIDGQAYRSWYGITHQNIDYSFGTTPTAAFQPFNLSTPQSSADFRVINMLGLTDVFAATMSCESLVDNHLLDLMKGNSSQVADVTVSLSYNHTSVGARYYPNMLYSLLIESPSCQLRVGFPGGNDNSAILPDRAQIYYVGCDLGDNTISEPIYTTVDRLQLFQYSVYPENADRVAFVITTQVANAQQYLISLLLCTPGYSFRQASVTIPYDNSKPPIVEHPHNGRLSNFSAMEIFTMTAHALSPAFEGQVLGILRKPSSSSELPVPLDNFFTMLNASSPRTALGEWHNLSALYATVTKSYSSFTAQLARAYFTAPSNKTMSGQIQGQQSRLIVRSLPLGLMIATIGIMILIGAILWHIAPRAVVPRDPTSIGGSALILTQNSAFLDIFVNTGHLDQLALSNHLKESTFISHVSWHERKSQFLVSSLPAEQAEPSTARTEQGWWKPFATTNYFKLTILVIIVASIVVLEILYRLSTRPQGLGEVPSNKNVWYVWTYLPITVIIGIGALLSNYESTVRTLQPYVALRKGNQPARLSLFQDHLSALAPYRLVVSLINRQATISAATTAVLVAPFLTVVVAGLFVPDVKPIVTSGSTFRQVDHFESFSASGVNVTQLSIAQADESYPPLVPSLPGAVLFGHLPPPPWTTGEYALPQIVNTDGDNTSGMNFSDPGSVQITMPALRGNANCSILPESWVVWERVENRYPATSSGAAVNISDIRINITEPGNCSKPISISSFRSPGILAETVLDHTDTIPDSTRDCMRFMGILGNVRNISNLWELSDSTLIGCQPFYELLNVSVTLRLPELSIEAVTPDESSISAFTIGTLNHSLMGWSFDELSIFGEAVASDANYTSSRLPSPAPPQFVFPVNESTTRRIRRASFISYSSTGPFLAAIFHQPTTNLTVLDAVRLDARPRILAAANRVYRTLAAQVASTYLRSPPVDVSTAPAINGTYLHRTQYRLGQDAASTRILQGLLGVILLSMIAAFIASPGTQGVVAHCPGSIAAVASLIAGSQSLGRTEAEGGIVPEGSEWWDDREVRRRGVFEVPGGFTLGWWDVQTQSPSGSSDGGEGGVRLVIDTQRVSPGSEEG